MLPNEIRGAKYHFVEIIREPSDIYLKHALAFQKIICSTYLQYLKG